MLHHLLKIVKRLYHDDDSSIPRIQGGLVLLLLLSRSISSSSLSPSGVPLFLGVIPESAFLCEDVGGGSSSTSILTIVSIASCMDDGSGERMGAGFVGGSEDVGGAGWTCGEPRGCVREGFAAGMLGGACASLRHGRVGLDLRKNSASASMSACPLSCFPAASSSPQYFVKNKFAAPFPPSPSNTSSTTHPHPPPPRSSPRHHYRRR